MAFEIDRQTLRDLELFGEKSTDPSIFSYFNRTKTFGGKLRLKQMMEHPLDDLASLRDRKHQLSFFIDYSFALSISSGQMDFIDRYFRLNKTVLQPNFLDGFFSRTWVRQVDRNDIYLIQTGVEKLAFLIHELEQWISGLPEMEEGMGLASIVAFIREYLQLPEIKHLLRRVGSTKALPAHRYDWIFRNKYRRESQQLVDYVYLLDAFNAVAQTAVLNGLAFADYLVCDTPRLELVDLFHPLLETAVSNHFAVAIPQNLCFLTGPNMAGKSTFLKSLGLTLYLAHLGFPVPAKSMQTTLYQGLSTTINLSDDRKMGYSHFYSEVNRIKEVALQLKEKKRLFVIFDELFRGTNVKDAYDASLLLIDAFAQIKSSTFCISTHITEIAEALEEKNAFLFKFFDAQIVDDVPRYSYMLQDGVSHERLGMLIIKNEKIIELLTDGAE